MIHDRCRRGPCHSQAMITYASYLSHINSICIWDSLEAFCIYYIPCNCIAEQMRFTTSLLGHGMNVCGKTRVCAALCGRRSVKILTRDRPPQRALLLSLRSYGRPCAPFLQSDDGLPGSPVLLLLCLIYTRGRSTRIGMESYSPVGIFWCGRIFVRPEWPTSANVRSAGIGRLVDAAPSQPPPLNGNLVAGRIVGLVRTARQGRGLLPPASGTGLTVRARHSDGGIASVRCHRSSLAGPSHKHNPSGPETSTPSQSSRVHRLVRAQVGVRPLC